MQYGLSQSYIVSRVFGMLICFAVIAIAGPKLDAFAQGSGFYSTNGPEIVDSGGNPVILRGVGLGGWLVPEGYMLDIAAPDGGSPTTIRAQIVDLIGETDADEFFRLYRENYVNEEDIAAIASWGHDHIRLPFHYKLFFDPDTETFDEDGFDLLDTFLEWCRVHDLRVILDMHAAPGAQNDGPISDSDGTARLWTEPVPYQDQTVAIWKEIATRYVADTTIIGYDLINEPVTPQGVNTDDLRALYVRIADSIRTVDNNHILFIEGNFYATDFGVLETPFDSNMVYAFHKYWNATDTGTIQYLLNLRSDTHVPLWLGETGENSNVWYYLVKSLVEANGIGWNWWTHKQIEATASPLSARYAPGYEAVLDYWRGSGPRPSARFAKDALFDMAHSLHIDSTEVRAGVLAALFEPNFSTLRRPFKEHRVPGVINAVDYDIGSQGQTYSDVDYFATSGTPGGGNTGGHYRNDGVDIERSTDPQGFDYNVGWVNNLEWLTYTFTADSTATYDIEVRVAAQASGGEFRLSVDDVQIGTDVSVPATGGWQNWVSVWVRNVNIEAGEHVLKLLIRRKEFNINRMTFTPATATGIREVGDDRVGGVRDPYPNPFEDLFTIPVRTAVASAIRIEIFDLLGRLAYTENAGVRAAGDHLLAIRPGLASGMYVCRVTIGDAVGADGRGLTVWTTVWTTLIRQ